MRGHVGPDDNIQGTHTDIRSSSEVDKWRDKNPITLVEKYLFYKKLIDNKLKNEIIDKINNEINEATKYALNSNFPNPKDLTKYVFK